MNYLLDVQHLDKTLGTFHLHDISFHLKPGYITGLYRTKRLRKNLSGQNNFTVLKKMQETF